MLVFHERERLRLGLREMLRPYRDIVVVGEAPPFVERDERIVAEMTYMRGAEGRIVIDLTAVSDERPGRASGVNWCARRSSTLASMIWKIIPVCPCARSVFDSTAEYQDIVA